MKDILIIEKESVLRDAIAEILKFEKFIVSVADNYKEGIAMAKTNVPDLVLYDTRLTDTDTTQVLTVAAADERTKQIKFVFITSTPFPEEQNDLKKFKVCKFLIKPFTRNDLLRVIESSFEK